MSNPFKKILQDEKLPEYLKERVIDNVNFIKLTLDVTGLYAVELPKALHSIIEGAAEEKQIEKEIEGDKLNIDNSDD